MKRTFVVSLLCPLIALAQAQPEEAKAAPPPVGPVAMPTPANPVVHAAVPLLNDWNVGAGLSFGTPVFGLADLAGGVPGLVGGLSSLSSTFGLSTQPRMTVLIERRLGERLFLGFQLAASFRYSQSDTFSAASYRGFSLDGTLGLRNLLNPRGVVEVSWFANVGVGYANNENRSILSTLDGMGGTTQTPASLRNSGFGVGAVAGLALERELLSGLALRLSSSVVGVSYSVSSTTSIVRDVTTEFGNHGFDGGLRFSPTIELRYAF